MLPRPVAPWGGLSFGRRILEVGSAQGRARARAGERRRPAEQRRAHACARVYMYMGECCAWPRRRVREATPHRRAHAGPTIGGVHVPGRLTVYFN